MPRAILERGSGRADQRAFTREAMRDTSSPTFAIERIRQGHRMPGLFLVPSTTSASVAVAELLAICQCSEHEEWEGLVVFLPL